MKNILIIMVMTFSLFSAPKAIVFDFGGVLMKNADRAPVVDFLRSTFQLSEDEFRKVNQKRKEAMQLGKSGEVFWLEYAEENGIALEESWYEDFKMVVWNSLKIRDGMYALVEELKGKNLKVGLLSNIDPFVSKMLREFGLYAPFEPCLLSCEIGVQKPDPKAYSILLSSLELPAEEVVFIDDRAENIEQAKECGLDAILFESKEQLCLELERRNLF